MNTIDEAAAFLAGAGLAYARRQLEAMRMPTALVEDVVQEALLAVVRAGESEVEIDNVEAYATRVVRNVVVDLVRGKARRPEVLARGGEDDVDPIDVAIDERALPELDAVAMHALADVRAAVVRRLVKSPMPAAGALAVLAHNDLLDPATPADDCPVPSAKGGATAFDAATWAGLFYAGRRNCWPIDGEDTEAIRKRRSRYARAQTAVLRDAAADAGLHEGADRG